MITNKYFDILVTTPSLHLPLDILVSKSYKPEPLALAASIPLLPQHQLADLTQPLQMFSLFMFSNKLTVGQTIKWYQSAVVKPPAHTSKLDPHLSPWTSPG